MNRAIWANLFWKEWREHRWKLAALTAIYLITYAICLYTIEGESPLENAAIVLTFFTPLAALFIAMGLAAKEEASGTANYLRAQPVALRYAAIAKLCLGMLTLFIPVLLILALAFLFIGLDSSAQISRSYPFDLGVHGQPLRFLIALLTHIASSGSLLLWFAVLGMSQRSELRAGVFAVVAVIALRFIFGVALEVTEPAWTATGPFVEAAWRTHNFVELGIVSPALPGAIDEFASYSPTWLQDQTAALYWTAFSIFCVTHSVLAWRWITGYGRTPIHALDSTSRKSSLAGWLGPPRFSSTHSILWKQIRESLPAIGGTIVLGLVWGGWILAINSRNGINQEGPAWTLAWTTAMSGFLAALFVGVASFQDDLSTGLSGFWRSRPIDPDQWFWIKYASGLAVLATVFGGVYALAWLLDPSESARSSEQILQVILAFWTVYASAVCVACLVRNVIYAGILSFAVAAYTTWLALVPYNGEQLPVALQALILTSVSVGLTLLAWQAMRRDWALRLA